MKSTGSKMTCMDIQLERAAETLNQGDGACVSSRFYITGFSGQVRSNGAVDNTQRLVHDFGLAGKQEPERKRHTEYPLTHGLMGQYFIYLQGSTFRHTTGPATGAEGFIVSPPLLLNKHRQTRLSFQTSPHSTCTSLYIAPVAHHSQHPASRDVPASL